MRVSLRNDLANAGTAPQGTRGTHTASPNTSGAHPTLLWIENTISSPKTWIWFGSCGSLWGSAGWGPKAHPGPFWLGQANSTKLFWCKGVIAANFSSRAINEIFLHAHSEHSGLRQDYGRSSRNISRIKTPSVTLTTHPGRSCPNGPSSHCPCAGCSSLRRAPVCRKAPSCSPE